MENEACGKTKLVIFSVHALHPHILMSKKPFRATARTYHFLTKTDGQVPP